MLEMTYYIFVNCKRIEFNFWKFTNLPLSYENKSYEGPLSAIYLGVKFRWFLNTLKVATRISIVVLVMNIYCECVPLFPPYTNRFARCGQQRCTEKKRNSAISMNKNDFTEKTIRSRKRFQFIYFYYLKDKAFLQVELNFNLRLNLNNARKNKCQKYKKNKYEKKNYEIVLCYETWAFFLRGSCLCVKNNTSTGRLKRGYCILIKRIFQTRGEV